MKKQRKILAIFLAAVLALAVLAGGCGGQGPAAGDKAPAKKISVGILKLTSSAPLFIALEKGFFKEQGLDIVVQWFEAAQPIAVATAANKIDVGATGITASLFNMVAGGQTLSIVADKGREQKGYSSSAVMVRSGLWDKGVRRIEDLKGKRIGITQIGSTYHYMIGRLLEEKGLTLADVELVPLTKLSAIMASLQSGQIDAAILNEPNIGKVAAAGYGKVVVQVGDVIDYQTSGIFYSPNLLKDKDGGLRFMKAYIKACRYYFDAALVQKGGKPAPGANYDEVVGIIAKYTGAPVDEVKAGLPYIDRDGKLLSKDIGTQADWYLKHKMIEKPVDAAKVANTSVWEEALKEVK